MSFTHQVRKGKSPPRHGIGWEHEPSTGREGSLVPQTPIPFVRVSAPGQQAIRFDLHLNPAQAVCAFHLLPLLSCDGKNLHFHYLSLPLSDMPSSPPPSSRPFGTLPDGQQVDAWTLRGSQGAEVEILTYGGIVSRIVMPDRAGHLADLVLGFDNLNDYLRPHPYFGATVGRVAGRIPGGKLTINGEELTLVRNDGPNHLHGGLQAIDKRLWTVLEVASEPHPSLQIQYISPDGEESYPGTAEIKVRFSLTSDNALLIETDVISDKPTPICLTNHSYFNLAGEGNGTVENHWLRIASGECIEVDQYLTPLGRREPVKEGINDFRTTRRVGDAIPLLFKRHGDVYWLRPDGRILLEPEMAASLVDPASGRTLEVLTTHTCLQFYTGLILDGSLKGKAGRPYQQHGGLCLECQDYSAALNYPGFGDILVRPGQPQRHTTVYAFGITPA